MRDAKRIIKEAREIQDFAIKRGHEVLKARSIKYNVYVDGIDIHEEELTVKFREDTDYDYADTEFVRFTADALDMGEEDWKAHLEKIRIDTEIEKAKKLKELEGTRVAREKAQYERFNRMFGDFTNAKP